MSIDMNNDGNSDSNYDNVSPENIPDDDDGTDACYETVASQEEIYLEETEEELRAILISEDPSSYDQGETDCVDCCFVAESLDEERGRAAEELITGDSDDPPLSENAVVEMLSLSRFYRSRAL